MENEMDIKRLQADLKLLGFYKGIVDGDWGPLSEAAYQSLLADHRVLSNVDNSQKLAWGRKVSGEFKERIIEICNALRIANPDWLMACIAFESGETFRADIRNMAGSGATGLIQFMPKTAIGLNTTVDKLAKMRPEDQLSFVWLYFKPYTGRLRNLGDVYMAILWPAGIGKPDDWVMWDQDERPTTYRQNIGLDVNSDKEITRGEAVGKIRAKLERGLKLFKG